MIYQVYKEVTKEVVVEKEVTDFNIPCYLKEDFYQDDSEYCYIDENFKVISLEVENHKAVSVTVYQAQDAQDAFEIVKRCNKTCSKKEWEFLMSEFIAEVS